MAQTNLEILKDLEDDLMDCTNHANNWSIDEMDKGDIALALFRELCKTKRNNAIIQAGLIGK